MQDFKVGDRVRACGDDRPADLYYEVTSTDAPELQVGGPRMTVLARSGESFSVAKSLMTTDAPLPMCPTHEARWGVARRLWVDRTLGRGDLAPGGKRRETVLQRRARVMAVEALLPGGK